MLTSILTGQGWFAFAMNLDGNDLNVSTFDGYTSYSYLGVVISVLFLTIAITAMSTRIVQRITLTLGFLTSAGLLVALSVALASTDVSGLAKELESATGIAMNHGASAAVAKLLWPAPVVSVLLGVVAVLFVAAIFSASRWSPRQKAKKSVGKPSIPKDAISLWDAQR